eukprot:1164314-Pyramimonas_sp.AAC.1
MEKKLDSLMASLSKSTTTTSEPPPTPPWHREAQDRVSKTAEAEPDTGEGRRAKVAVQIQELEASIKTMGAHE